MRQKQADALDAYWKSQNQKIKQLESFVEQGGSISPELNQMTAEFEQSGISVFEQLMQGQKMLLTSMEQLGVQKKIEKTNRQTEEKTIAPKTLQAEQISSVPATKKNTNPWANEVIDAIDLNDPKSVKRLDVQMVLCEDTPRANNALPKSGIMIMLGEKDAYGMALENYFVKNGLKTKWIDYIITKEEQGSQQIKDILKEDEIAGMAVLGNRYHKNEEEKEHYCDYVMTIGYLLKPIAIYMRERKSSEQILFLFETFLDGKLGITGKSEYCQYGAFYGIAKSLAVELQDKVFVKAIDFEPTMDIDTMISYTEDELCCHDGLAEVGRAKDGLRYRTTAVVTKSVVTENKCPLTENDIILVSGGARGVTSSCILELAKKVKCKFVILGRTEIVEENADDEETKKVTELKGMKTLVAKRFKKQGYKSSFAAIEEKAKAILAQRDMLNTFNALKEIGNEIYYYSCDVKNRQQMKKVIEKIEHEVGKITAVVHGAGTIADSKMWNKDMNLFKSVFETKYKGLNNIMDFVDKNSIKALVMFSSISGYFGNEGQVDYVAGNEYLDKYAYYIRERYPNCRALAINWGAWHGGMMAVDGLYAKILAERGYVLIPLEVGANYFVNDFLMGLPSAQVLINNSGLPAKPLEL